LAGASGVISVAGRSGALPRRTAGKPAGQCRAGATAGNDPSRAGDHGLIAGKAIGFDADAAAGDDRTPGRLRESPARCLRPAWKTRLAVTASASAPIITSKQHCIEADRFSCNESVVAAARGVVAGRAPARHWPAGLPAVRRRQGSDRPRR